MEISNGAGRLVSRRGPPRSKKNVRPIPLTWCLAASCDIRFDCGVALLLWFTSGLAGSAEFEIYPATRQQFGISRMRLKRALDRFECAGLVELNRNGRRTIVRLIVSERPP